MSERTSRHGALLFWLLIPLGLIALAVIAVWSARGWIAELALGRYCAAKALVCTADLKIRSLDSIEGSNVLIRPSEASGGLRIGTVSATLNWTGFLKPSIASLDVNRPVLNVSYRNDTLDIGGLDRLLGGPASGSPPNLAVRDGLMVIETAAGTVTGRIEAEGRFPQNGQFEAEFEPTRMRALTNEIALEAGQFTGSLSDGELSANLELRLSSLRLGRTQADNLELRVTTDKGAPGQLDWTIGAGSLERRNISVRDLAASGRATIEFDQMSNAVLWRQILPLQASGTSGDTSVGSYSSEQTAFVIDVSAEPDRPARVSGELDLLGLESSFGSAEDIVLTYEGSFEPRAPSAAGRGSVIISHATLADDLVRQIRELFPSAGPLGPHQTQLANTIADTADDMSMRAEFRVDVENPNAWRAIASNTIAVQGANSVSLVVEPGIHGPVLSLSPDGAELSGLASLRGPAAPQLTADIRRLSLRPSSAALVSGGVRLEPWTVDGKNIAASLSRLDLDWSPNLLNLSVLGELSLDGDFLSLGLKRARLFGGIEAIRDTAGLRIQTLDEPCLGVQLAESRISSAVRVADLALTVCPENGRLLQGTNAAYSGKFSISDPELPLEGESFEGLLNLDSLVATWQFEQQLQLDIVADRLEFPMTIGQRTLGISGDNPRIALGIGERPDLDLTLHRVTLDGTLVPADVSVDRLEFDGWFGGDGRTGTANASGVLISDRGEDPLYAPLSADTVVQFDGSQMTAQSIVRLADRDRRIGTADLTVDLIDVTGTVRLLSDALAFDPSGLQPKHISDRVRGLLSNANGRMTASAILEIDGGNLSGTGDISVASFGFDTLRLGRVSGVNGTIHFDDILKLSTPNGQRVTIKQIEPGFRLSDGEILFQLRPDGEAQLEQASWPLAGGRLVVDPTVWTLSGRRDTVTVNAEEIELSELVDVLSLPDIEAEGTVSGSFPIVFEQGDVLIRNARLFADEKGGVLRYTGRTLDPAAATDTRVDAAFRALRDFHFKVLEVGLDGNLIGKLILRLDLLGFNPDVLEGAPFKFSISIDSELAQLIEQGRRATTTEWLARAVVVGNGGALPEE